MYHSFNVKGLVSSSNVTLEFCFHKPLCNMMLDCLSLPNNCLSKFVIMSFGLPKSVTISPLFSRDMIKHFLFLPLATPVDTKIWFEKEGPPRSKFVKGKPKYSARSANQCCHQPSKMTPSYQGDGLHWQGQRDMKKTCQTS